MPFWDLASHEAGFTFTQVPETDADLESLEELAASPLIAGNPAPYLAFFRAAPALLAPPTQLPAFQTRLLQLLSLLPDNQHLLAFCAE